MVGIGTAEVNLEKFKYNFGSLLGHDEDSWGLSYTGLGSRLDGRAETRAGGFSQ